jgi:CxxC motif-containing protein
LGKKKSLKNDIKNLVCIVCPLGCKLTVEKDGDSFKVNGNSCKRGHDYAIEEMTHPMRMLTSTMKLVNSRHVRIAVHTSAPIPKEKIFDAMDVINTTTAHAPFEMGDVLIKNILDTGVDVCSSRTIND